MDDDFADRLADKLLKSDQALERFKNQGSQPMSADEVMAAIVQVAEATAMMEELAESCLQKSYEQAVQESKQPRNLH